MIHVSLQGKPVKKHMTSHLESSFVVPGARLECAIESAEACLTAAGGDSCRRLVEADRGGVFAFEFKRNGHPILVAIPGRPLSELFDAAASEATALSRRPAVHQQIFVNAEPWTIHYAVESMRAYWSDVEQPVTFNVDGSALRANVMAKRCLNEAVAIVWLGDINREVAAATRLATDVLGPMLPDGAEHWHLLARDLWTCAILHALYSRGSDDARSVADAIVAAVGCSSQASEHVLQRWLSTVHWPGAEQSWRVDGVGSGTHATVAVGARRLLGLPRDERHGVFLQALRVREA